MKRPSRAQLLRVIEELQGLVGEALAAYRNDRDLSRSKHVIAPLERAHAMCIEARSADPPVIR